jgi:hypothetical protein
MLIGRRERCIYRRPRMTTTLLLRVADRVGVSISAACAIHCLAAPVLLTFLSIAGFEENIELLMIGISLMIAAVTFTAGFVRNTTVLPLALLLVGAPVMIASRSVHHPWAEPALLIAGAVLLSIGHVVNLRRGHLCSDECACPETSRRLEQ